MVQRTAHPNYAPRNSEYVAAKLRVLESRISSTGFGPILAFDSLEQLFKVAYHAREISKDNSNGNEAVVVTRKFLPRDEYEKTTEGIKFVKDDDYYYCPTCNKYYGTSPAKRRNQRQRCNEYVCRICETVYKRTM